MFQEISRRKDPHLGSKRVPKSLNQDLSIRLNLIDKPKVVSQSQKLTTWFL